MADKRITELDGLTNVAKEDLLAVVDVSEQKTKRVAYGNLLPAGSGGSGLGWARYDDSNYTQVSPLTLINGASAIVLPNNASNTIDTFMNSSKGFYDGTTNKVLMENDGDVYSMIVVFKAGSTNASQAHLDLELSSTGTTPYDRVSKSFGFTKGNLPSFQNFYESFHFYGDSDFVTNGNQWKVRAEGADVKIWDIIFFIQRTFNAG